MIKQAEQPFSIQHFGRLLFRNRKKAGMYGLFLVVVSFNLCLFLPANMHTPAAEQMVTAVQLLCFAVMGIINTWFFCRPDFLEDLAFSAARLAYFCLLFIVIALVLFVYYYVSGNNSLIMAFASSGAFLLPFLIYQGFTEFMGIPARSYPIWCIPENDTAAGQLAFTVNSLQVQVSIARHANDVQQNVFPVTVSGKVKLGRMFEKFVADNRLQGSQYAIETKDKSGQTFGWQFFELKWRGIYRRNLNPLYSLTENKLGPNAKIIAVRIHQYHQ